MQFLFPIQRRHSKVKAVREGNGMNQLARYQGVRPYIVQACCNMNRVPRMPAKRNQLSGAKRAKRIRETAREIGTDNDPEAMERAFKKVLTAKPKPATVVGQFENYHRDEIFAAA